MLDATGHHKAFRHVWVILTNTIMLILAANLALGVLFLATDKIASLPLSQKARFDQAGAPINWGTAYQRDWFDYTPYEGDKGCQKSDTPILN